MLRADTLLLTPGEEAALNAEAQRCGRVWRQGWLHEDENPFPDSVSVRLVLHRRLGRRIEHKVDGQTTPTVVLDFGQPRPEASKADLLNPRHSTLVSEDELGAINRYLDEMDERSVREGWAPARSIGVEFAFVFGIASRSIVVWYDDLAGVVVVSGDTGLEDRGRSPP